MRRMGLIVFVALLLGVVPSASAHELTEERAERATNDLARAVCRVLGEQFDKCRRYAVSDCFTVYGEHRVDCKMAFHVREEGRRIVCDMWVPVKLRKFGAIDWGELYDERCRRA